MSSVPITLHPPTAPPARPELDRAHLFVLVARYLLDLVTRAHHVVASFVQRTHWTFSVLLVLLALSLVFFAFAQPRRRTPRHAA